MPSNISPFPIRDRHGRFVTGNIGGPGRPRGSRNRLAAEFISALQADFEAHGIGVIACVRQTDPAAYLRVVSVICRPLLHTEQDADPYDFDRMESVEEIVQALSEMLGAERAVAVVKVLEIGTSSRGKARV